ARCPRDAARPCSGRDSIRASPLRTHQLAERCVANRGDTEKFNVERSELRAAVLAANGRGEWERQVLRVVAAAGAARAADEPGNGDHSAHEAGEHQRPSEAEMEKVRSEPGAAGVHAHPEHACPTPA